MIKEIDALIAATARPLPFEPSARNICTDPWIAPGMLAAHLDDSTDAASRAPAQRERAIGWIADLSPGRRRVLDLGCGPGLYAEAFAARGCAVTGMDLSPSSVEHARASAAAKGLDIDYRRGDYSRDELGGGFELAMMIYCDFGALAPAAELVLVRVREALAPGGLFVFDVLGPGLAAQKPARSWQASGGAGLLVAEAPPRPGGEPSLPGEALVRGGGDQGAARRTGLRDRGDKGRPRREERLRLFGGPLRGGAQARLADFLGMDTPCAASPGPSGTGSKLEGRKI